MYVTKLSVSISSDMIDNSCSVKELNETHARHGAHICGIVTIATTTTSVASGRRPLGPKANIAMSHGKHHYISSSSSSYMGPHHIHTHIHTYLTNCVLHAPPTTNNNNNHQKTEGFFLLHLQYRCICHCCCFPASPTRRTRSYIAGVVFSPILLLRTARLRNGPPHSHGICVCTLICWFVDALPLILLTDARATAPYKKSCRELFYGHNRNVSTVSIVVLYI